ncbi:MAG: TetR/AcrR family transcriptional regulator [Salinisphaeraceae bacterium]|nr:TetR/AcrR family transcriptional regulator [Salinisphaeraceae bacterium]
MNAQPAPKTERRTQAQRSDAMRQRLLNATLDCLVEDGYANTTLSGIVRRAGVSRGAQVHHYPNKQALMADAAEHLLRRSYKELGELLLSVANEEDRLEALAQSVWEHMFANPLFRAYSELLVASQRDPELSDAMRKLMSRFNRVFEPASTHYFERIPGAPVPMAVFGQLSAICSGIAIHTHLLEDPDFVKRQLRLWVSQAKQYMKPVKGVHTPPPRPETWDALPES